MNAKTFSTSIQPASEEGRFWFGRHAHRSPPTQTSPKSKRQNPRSHGKRFGDKVVGSASCGRPVINPITNFPKKNGKSNFNQDRDDQVIFFC